MKYILKIFLIVLLVVAIIGAACWFFLVQRPDLTMSVFAYWGDHFYDAGRYNRAVSLYETACRLDPQNANLPSRCSTALQAAMSRRRSTPYVPVRRFSPPKAAITASTLTSPSKRPAGRHISP